MGETEQAVLDGGLPGQAVLEREPNVVQATEPLEPVVASRALAPSQRDSLRRRMLAGGDVMAILLAYGVVLLLSPPMSLGSRLFLLCELPLWVLLNKLLGLYDRDANVIRKSTLDELPRIAHSVILGSAASFLLVPLIPGMEMFREQTLLFILALMLSMPAVRTGVRFAFNSRSEPERTLIVGSGSVAQLLASKLAKHW
jgi:FlaA1/EpsC-like NDP-sugar epimerase